MSDRTQAVVKAAERLAEAMHLRMNRDAIGEEYLHHEAIELDDFREDVRAAATELVRALALPARAEPEVSLGDRIETLTQLVDLTHQNAERSLRETSRCVRESLAEIRAELGTPASAPAWTKTPPSEPGLYFLRVPDPRGKHRIKIGAFNPQQGHGEVSFIVGDLGVPLAELNEHEWWPVPIQPPEET